MRGETHMKIFPFEIRVLCTTTIKALNRPPNEGIPFGGIVPSSQLHRLEESMPRSIKHFTKTLHIGFPFHPSWHQSKGQWWWRNECTEKCTDVCEDKCRNALNYGSIKGLIATERKWMRIDEHNEPHGLKTMQFKSIYVKAPSLPLSLLCACLPQSPVQTGVAAAQ